MSHNEESKHWGTSTRCLHAGNARNEHGGVTTPIYQCSTFVFDTADQGGDRFAGKEKGYIYTRLGNPTNRVLEEKIANLEGTEDCAVTASGMAAISSTVLTLCSKGDHVLADGTLYGCTVSLFTETLPRFGIEVTLIDASIPGEVKKHMKENTKILYIETPANPTLKIIDIAQVAKDAHEHHPGVYVIADNTFSTPIFQNPISLGCDIVIHSMTKYINGHTDVVSGCVCSTSETINQIKMIGLKDITGAVLSPHDAYLVIRGMMTLDIRVKKCAENAQKVAEFLEKHPLVDKIHYPGLKCHPNYELAKKQMHSPGSMISFELKGGINSGKTLLDNLKIITLAVSLGGCESLIQHPASMTHAIVPPHERLTAGITDGLVRLSVGLEEVDDLISDLTNGLNCIKQ